MMVMLLFSEFRLSVSVISFPHSTFANICYYVESLGVLRNAFQRRLWRCLMKSFSCLVLSALVLDVLSFLFTWP